MAAYAEVLRRFADDVEGDSPFYASLARAAADDPVLVEKIGAAPPGRHHPTLLFAAVHDLVLAGTDHPVAAAYASARPGDDAATAFVTACHDLWPEIAETLATRSTQTNEPNRSAVLRLGLIAAAGGGPGPVALVDVGCSAGLNLIPDRYGYTYEPGGVVGERSSPVMLHCDVRRGRPAIDPAPPIVHRVGVDRRPVDARDASQRRWLQACVWPDQPERAARLEAALTLLAEAPPPVVTGDALDVLPDVIARCPADALPVITTTWVLAYFSKPDRAAFADMLRAASTGRPLTWVAAEAAGVAPLIPASDTAPDATGTVLSVARFDGGDVSARVVGACHPHGRWIAWSEETAPAG